MAVSQWPGKNRPWFAWELRVTDAFKLELLHWMRAFVRQVPKYQGSIRLGVAHGISAALLESNAIATVAIPCHSAIAIGFSY